MTTPDDTRAAEERAAQFEREHPLIAGFIVRPLVWVLLLPESIRHRRRMRALRRMNMQLEAINDMLARSEAQRSRRSDW